MKGLQLPASRYLLLLLPLLLGAIGYSLASANVMPGSSAGDGTGLITAYTVSNISTTLDIANDPTQILSVTFELTPAAASVSVPRTVYARFLNSGVQSGSWYACTLSGTSWSCSLPSGGASATVQVGIELEVVAAQ